MLATSFPKVTQGMCEGQKITNNLCISFCKYSFSIQYFQFLQGMYVPKNIGTNLD